MSTATDREDFVVGADDRPPETDQSGMYPAVCANVQKVQKTPEEIDREVKMYGKDPEKIDKYRYVWDFSVPGFDQTLRVWSGTFFGEKAKATDIAAALIGHRPGKAEVVRASQLWDRPCQVLVEFDQEKGRNRITKVMAPRQTASTPVQEQPAPTFAQAAIAGGAEDDPGFWDRAVAQDPGPEADEG